MMKAHTVRDVRLFGGAFTVVCGGFGAWMLAGGRTVPGALLLGAAAYFLAGVLVAPAILRPPFFVWVRFAFALGWVNSRILLGLFFGIVLTPAGLVGRLRRRDALDRRIERDGKTYWRERPGADASRERYERQF